MYVMYVCMYVCVCMYVWRTTFERWRQWLKAMMMQALIDASGECTVMQAVNVL